MYYALGALFLFFLLQFFVKRIKTRLYVKKGITQLRADLDALRSNLARIKTLYDSSQLLSPEAYAGVPHDSYLDTSWLPREYGAQSELDDRYYFGFNPGSGTVHEPWCRHCGPLVNYSNILRICAFPHPCMKCSPRLPNIQWVRIYRDVLRNLEPIDPGITERHLDLLCHGETDGCVINAEFGELRPTEDDLAFHLQACVDEAYQEVFAGKLNPYSCQPISSERDYLAYASEYERLHGEPPVLPRQAESLRHIAFRKKLCQDFLYERLRLFRSNTTNILHMK